MDGRNVDEYRLKLNPKGVEEPVFLDASLGVIVEGEDHAITPLKFLETAEKNGWPNATTDNLVRAFVCLYDPNIPGMQEIADSIYKGGGENKDKERESLTTALYKIALKEGRELSVNQQHAADWVNGLRAIPVDPEKTVYGMKPDAFFQAAENAGWENAKNDPVLQAFCVVYDANINGFDSAAEKITTGQYDIFSREEYRHAILISLENTLKGKDNLSDAEKTVMERIAVYKEEHPKEMQFYDYVVNNIGQPEAQNINEIENNELNINEINENEKNDEIINDVNNEELGLVQIIDRDRVVEGKNWEQFHQAFSEKGWKNAEKDNTLRAMYNLCTEDHPTMIDNVKLILSQEYNENLAENYVEHIRNYVRDQILEKAKKGEDYKFEENQRESVLHFQELLNNAKEEGPYHYDFNDYCPPVEEKEVILDNNLINNEIINDIKEEEFEQNPEEVQPKSEEEHLRPALDNVVLKVYAKRALDELDANTLRLRGSDEYKNAREEFRKALDKWTQAVDKNKDGKVAQEDLQVIRGDLLNVLYMQDAYIGKKSAEQDKSRNAEKRVSAMAESFKIVEEMIYALDLRQEELDKQPAPDVTTLSVKAALANSEIRSAKLFARGSEEYKTAANDFEIINRRMKEISDKYSGKEDKITVAELEEMQEMVIQSKDYISDYLGNKVGYTLSNNTHNRTSAMFNARGVLVEFNKKLNQLLEAKEAQPIKSLEDIKSDAEKKFADIEEAEIGVHLGSKAYTNAKNDYKAAMDRIKLASEDGDGMGRRSLDELDAAMDKSIKSIDAYLVTKKGKELSQKTDKRVDAMRQAKENLLEMKKKHQEMSRVRQEKARDLELPLVQGTESTALRELESAQSVINGKTVYFGGKDYDKALDLYKKAMNNEWERDRKMAGKTVSRNALEEELQELKEAKKATLVYMERKEKESKDKGKQLDDKGKRRYGAMSDAYHCLNRRIERVEEKLNALDVKEKADQEEKMKEVIEQKRLNIKNKVGVDKIVEMESLSAVKNLAAISKQKKFTKDDPATIKMCLGVLMVEELFRSKTAAIRIYESKRNFEEMVGKVIETPAFKSAFPDKSLNSKLCRDAVINNNVIKNASKKFLDAMRKNASKNKINDMKIVKDLNNGNKENKPVNPLK